MQLSFNDWGSRTSAKNSGGMAHRADRLGRRRSPSRLPVQLLRGSGKPAVTSCPAAAIPSSDSLDRCRRHSARTVRLAVTEFSAPARAKQWPLRAAPRQRSFSCSFSSWRKRPLRPPFGLECGDLILTPKQPHRMDSIPNVRVTYADIWCGANQSQFLAGKSSSGRSRALRRTSAASATCSSFACKQQVSTLWPFRTRVHN